MIIIDFVVGWVVIFLRNDIFFNKGLYGWFFFVLKSYLIFYVCGFVFWEGMIVKFFNIVDFYFLMCKLFGIEFCLNNGFLENVEVVLKKINMEILKGV